MKLEPERAGELAGASGLTEARRRARASASLKQKVRYVER
jgi:hypothetical protein